MTTNVYVDGFNLYYGSVKDTPYKWLDLQALFSSLLPGHQLKRIRYFTAMVSGFGDPDRPQRQLTYLRAIETIPGLSVQRGQFRKRQKHRPVMPVQYGVPQSVWVLDRAGQSQHLQIDPKPPNGAQFVWVHDREEKGSDVNLATHLLVDAYHGDFDTAVVVSDDADLLEPIIQVRKEFGVRVEVLNPQTWRVRTGQIWPCRR